VSKHATGVTLCTVAKLNVCRALLMCTFTAEKKTTLYYVALLHKKCLNTQIRLVFYIYYIVLKTNKCFTINGICSTHKKQSNDCEFKIPGYVLKRIFSQKNHKRIFLFRKCF